MIALIDGDIIAYKVAHAIKNDPDADKAYQYNVDSMIDKILAETKNSNYKVYLTGSSNFRKGLGTTLKYKANRANTPKPLWLDKIYEYIEYRYNAEVVEGMEADDAMGIEQMRLAEHSTSPKGAIWKSVICTIDKDLNMIPGWHYNFDKKIYYGITEQEAYINFYRQCLTGDKAVDNVDGLAKVGKVTASKIITDDLTIPEMHEKVINTYYKAADCSGIIKMKSGLFDSKGISLDLLIEEIMLLLWIRRGNDLEDTLFGKAWEWPEKVLESRIEFSGSKKYK